MWDLCQMRVDVLHLAKTETLLASVTLHSQHGMVGAER